MCTLIILDAAVRAGSPPICVMTCRLTPWPGFYVFANCLCLFSGLPERQVRGVGGKGEGCEGATGRELEKRESL